MKTFVLDCSVTMAWCFLDEKTDYTESILDLLETHRALVPALWHLEVVNVLHQAHRHHRIDEIQQEAFLSFLAQLPIETTVLKGNSKDLLKLCGEYTITAYDACYLALSIENNIPLITIDKDFKKATLKAQLPLL